MRLAGTDTRCSTLCEMIFARCILCMLSKLTRIAETQWSGRVARATRAVNVRKRTVYQVLANDVRADC
jgi:hypothetical protein